jgi:two-component system cell cycle sensor histidine kinase/response regulator CckA
MTTDPNTFAIPRPLRVVIVEDVPEDAELLCRYLTRAGFELHSDVVSTRSALAERLRTTACHLVLSDFNLRDWSGLDALEIVRQQGRDIPFILVTGTIGEERAVQVMKAGAADYVLKDNLSRLSEAIRQTLSHVEERRQRRQAEQALAESEHKFRAMTEASPSAIYIHDGERLLYANSAASIISGCSREELLAGDIWQVVHPEDSQMLQERMKSWLQGQEVSDRQQIRTVTKGGEQRWLDFCAAPIEFDGRPAVLCAGIDITDQRRVEEQLRQSQKLEGIGLLSGGIAHDFNNLLNVIIGYSDLLLREVSPGKTRERLLQIVQAAERGAALTRQLLAFSRKQVLQPQVANLNTIVQEIQKLLTPLIGENIAIHTSLHPALGLVKVDPGQIEQVIMNLAVNARDSMSHGGELKIATDNVEFDQDDVRTRPGVGPGSGVVLSVSDTGSGMDAATKARIFEPFFTTKEVGKGTGLGLSTVYGIVKQSGGDILVDSELGQGTTFTIYLPRVFAEPEHRLQKEARVTKPRRKATVLVLEDDAALRTLACECLESEGFTILAATTGAEAIHFAENHPGPIDLLLTDVVLPGMNGKESSSRIRKLRPEIQVIYVSGYTNDAVSKLGILEAGSHFLQKPYGIADLTNKLSDLVEAAAAETHAG